MTFVINTAITSPLSPPGPGYLPGCTVRRLSPPLVDAILYSALWRRSKCSWIKRGFHNYTVYVKFPRNATHRTASAFRSTKRRITDYLRNNSKRVSWPRLWHASAPGQHWNPWPPIAGHRALCVVVHWQAHLVEAAGVGVDRNLLRHGDADVSMPSFVAKRVDSHLAVLSFRRNCIDVCPVEILDNVRHRFRLSNNRWYYQQVYRTRYSKPPSPPGAAI